MAGFYDASAPPPDDSGSTRDALRRMADRDADTRLQALLDDVGDFVAAAREHDLQGEGLDPDVAHLLDAIAGADGAPAEFAALHRRVEQHRLTWDQLWRAPEAEPGGLALVGAAMRAAGAELAAVVRQAEEERERAEDDGGETGPGRRS